MKLKVDQLSVRRFLLILINASLLAYVSYLVLKKTSVEGILAAQPVTIASEQRLLVPSVATNFDVIQSQALFHESRQYFTQPDPTTVVMEVAPPDYRFAGAMTLPKQPIMAMLVNNQTGVRSKVKQGDTLDGWLVESVGAKSIMLSLNGKQIEVSAQSSGQYSGQSSGQSSGLRSGIQAVPMSALASSAPSNGIRVLSGGASRGVQSGSALPPAPPGGVGARLYQPPPSE